MRKSLFIACGGLVLALFPAAAAPVDVTARTAITTGNPRTTLDRVNGVTTSSVEVTIQNTGDRILEPPLHAAIFFTAPNGSLAGLEVAGASGGLEVLPYQTFFFDLSANIGAGLAPQASTSFTLRFTPPKEVRVSYRVMPFATVDADPVARAGGPYQARAGTEVVFDGTASSDPEGGALTFEWNFGDGSPTAPGAIARHSFSAPGLYEATLSVRDPRNHLTVVRVPVAIAPAADFAVARVRTLDGAGLPLGGVAIEERRNDQPRNLSSSSGGFAPLGNGIGSYRWKFSKPGYLAVWRHGQLLINQATIIANPWLAKENGQKSTLSPLNDALLISPSQNVRALFNAGAFPQGGQGAITDLSAQTLPFPLPLGWSPIAQFHLGLTEPPAEAGAATLSLPEALGSGQQAALVLYNAPAQRWEVRALVAGNGTTSVGAELLAGGSYALVLPDAAPFIPPSAEIGQPLTGTTQAFEVGNVTATGSVTPDVSPASREAAAVTASARVVFSNPQPLPSGLFFPTRVTEKYALANERTARTPDYDTTVFAYHRPGSGLAAEFPMRPQLLFGPEELREATVKCEVLAPGGFKGGVIDGTGGVLGGDGIRVTIPAGAVAQAQPAELTPLDPQPFAAGLPIGVTAIKAFAINLAELAEGKALSIAIEGLEPNALYVLALAVSDAAGSGVTPLERFASDAVGRLSSAEPQSGPRLPGARGAGDYVLLKITAPLALVQGIARDSAGNPAPGLAIRSIGQPWLVFSAADGAYKTLAATGAVVLTVFDPRDGNEGSASITINDPGQPQTIDLGAVPTGPRVVIVEPAVDPSPAAAKVRTVTPIVAHFSEAITSASFGADGMTLTKDGGTAVAGSLSLNLARTEANFLPANPLDPDTTYTITVSAAVRDGQNLALEGNRVFTFKTAKPATRGEGAQLVIYEPGADNIPASILPLPGYSSAAGSSHVVAQGSAGTADPGVSVILVNQTTGETATVVSNPDGSFANFINAAEEDFISAVFVNANGTRIEVPATRQLFDDGRVGLYAGGGILEAESDGGPIQVLIEPHAIPNRTTFKIDVVAMEQLLQLLNDTPPKGATFIGDAVQIQLGGDKLDQNAGNLVVRLPASEDQLRARGIRFENGKPVAIFTLSLPVKVSGEIAYFAADQLEYENGQLVTKLSGTNPAGNPLPLRNGLAAASFDGSAGGGGAAGAPGDAPTDPSSPDASFPGAQYFTKFQGGVQEFLEFLTPVGAAIDPAGTILMAGLAAIEASFPTIYTGKSLEVQTRGGQIVLGKPLGGALVSLEPLGPGSLGSARPGKLDPGTVFTVSRATGGYAMRAPRHSPEFALRATHPRFFGQPAIALPAPPLATVSITDLLFFNNLDLSPTPGSARPQLFPSHDPHLPAPDTVAELQVLATHTTGHPDLEVIAQEVIPLVSGQIGSVRDVSIVKIREEDVGATARRFFYSIRCSIPAEVRLLLTSFAVASDTARAPYTIVFGGVEENDSAIEAPDADDKQGPRLIRSEPSNGDVAWDASRALVFVFNEAIDKSAEGAGADIATLDPPAGPAVGEVSPNQRTLTLRYPELKPGTPYRLLLGRGIRDVAPNPNRFQPLAIEFKTAATPIVDLREIRNGGGAIVRGIYSYVADRMDQSLDGRIVIFDHSNPSEPVKVSEVSLPGPANDLVFIPGYSFKRRPGSAVETADILAVIGGALGGTADSGGNINGAPKFLWLLNVTDPPNPTRLAAQAISFSLSEQVTRLRFEAPLLSYFSNSADVQNINVVNLQTYILTSHMTPEEFSLNPRGTPGEDLNDDGDYVDTGEKLPFPEKNPTFFGGLVAIFQHEGTTQRVEDYDLEVASLTVGVTLTAGFRRNVLGDPIPSQPVAAGFQTIATGGVPLNDVTAFLPIPGARLKRMEYLFGIGVPGANGAPRLANLALLSKDPLSAANSALVIVEVTDPLNPTVLGEIEVDRAKHGLFQSASLRKEDGMLLVATTNTLFVLDPFRLGDPQSPGKPHPALLAEHLGLGVGTRTFGSIAAGLSVVSQGLKNQALQTPPKLQFVRAPSFAPLDPATLVTDVARRTSVLADLQPTGSLLPARLRSVPGVVESSITPPGSASHYYVVVDALGSAGESIPILLESLDSAREPLRNRGRGFPPVRAATPATAGIFEQAPAGCPQAQIQPLLAFRLSDNKADPLYNKYLSQPFALLYEPIGSEEIADLERPDPGQAIPPRRLLWSGASLRASLDPELEQNPAIGAFASVPDVSRKIVRAGVSVTAESLAADYVMGPNPPPITGFEAVGGTDGMLAAHSGEIRATNTDIALPSRRLPIVFRRTLGAQDLHSGVFGRGWDFNYNERIVALDGGIFLPGMKVPLIIAGANRSEIGNHKDLLFFSGSGRTELFRFAGTTPPTEMVDDPLLRDLGWFDKAKAFYLAPEGVFDVVLRFKDDTFVRLQPNGERHFFGGDGRLTKIQDRYPDNSLTFDYNERGELVRINDLSVSERWLALGYYRAPGDRRNGPDKEAPHPAAIGKVCALRDWTGRDVLFEYDPCGRLTTRRGIEIAPGHPESHDGRKVVLYSYKEGFEKANALSGVTAGTLVGSQMFIANTFSPQQDVPVVTEGSGANGPQKLDLSQANTAAAVASGNAKSKHTAPDQTTAIYSFDEAGRATLVETEKGPAKSTLQQRYERGLARETVLPEGNRVEVDFENTNTIRSRANVVRLRRFPDPARGGPAIPEQTFSYDGRFNLPNGPQTDPNGNTITYRLTGDARSVEDIVYPNAGTVHMGYNGFGQLTSQTNLDGTEQSFFYDNARGFLTETRQGHLPTVRLYQGVDGDRGYPSRVTPPDGDFASFDYDEVGREITIEHSTHKIMNSYDLSGRALRVERRMNDGTTLVERATYLQNGFLTKSVLESVEDGTGVLGTGAVDLTIEYLPDPSFRVMEIKYQGGEGPPGGRTRRYSNFDDMGRPQHMSIGQYSEDYTYDKNGNPRTITRAGAVESFVYDGHDRLIKHSTPVGNQSFETREQTYFPRGDVETLTVTNVDGTVALNETYTVDSAGRLIGTIRDGNSASGVYSISYDQRTRSRTLTTPQLEQRVATWNVAGQLIKSESFTADIDYEYQGSSLLKNVIITEGPSVFIRGNGYDSFNRLQTLFDPIGTLISLTRRSDGSILETRDGNNNLLLQSLTKLGEQLTTTRANGIVFKRQYHPSRALAGISDAAGRGHRYDEDTTFRPSGTTWRDGSTTTALGFDLKNNQPSPIQTPVAQLQMGYDSRGRLTQRTIIGAPARTDTYGYDALGRVTSATFPAGSWSASYDKLGPSLSTNLTVGGFTYSVATPVRNDGTRLSITYPIGLGGPSITLTEARDVSGRLTSVTPVGGTALISNIQYVTAEFPGNYELGGGALNVVDAFDERKRIVARTWSKQSGATVAAVRYAYDLANNIQVRQYLHRGTRADLFSYDAGNRLTRTDFAVRCDVPTLGTRVLNGFSSSDFAPGLYSLRYKYDGAGLDFFEETIPENPDSFTLPALGFQRINGGPFLNPLAVDGVTRAADALGNLTRANLFVRKPGQTVPTSVGANLFYDAYSQLIRIDRDDGVQLRYEYDHLGLLVKRTLHDPTLPVPDETIFVWHNGLLLAEHDAVGRAKARYYYADGDVPIAADLPNGAGSPRRIFYIKEHNGSVIAVTNDAGDLIERYGYEAYGQPEILPPDNVGPLVASVHFAGPDLRVSFSERALPPPQAVPSRGLVLQLASLAGKFTVVSGGQTIPADAVLEETASGFAFGTVFRVQPTASFTLPAELRIAAGALVDEGGNLLPAQNIPLQGSLTPGARLFGEGEPVTAPAPIAQSALGNRFLFQGQFFDYEAGLFYMRSRFYDPANGAFLQRDPEQYADSVNLYAGFAHNPTTFRDPTGRATGLGLFRIFGTLKTSFKAVARGARNSAPIQRAATLLRKLPAFFKGKRGFEAPSPRVIDSDTVVLDRGSSIHDLTAGKLEGEQIGDLSKLGLLDDGDSVFADGPRTNGLLDEFDDDFNEPTLDDFAPSPTRVVHEDFFKQIDDAPDRIADLKRMEAEGIVRVETAPRLQINGNRGQANGPMRPVQIADDLDPDLAPGIRAHEAGHLERNIHLTTKEWNDVFDRNPAVLGEEANAFNDTLKGDFMHNNGLDKLNYPEHVRMLQTYGNQGGEAWVLSLYWKEMGYSATRARQELHIRGIRGQIRMDDLRPLLNRIK